LNKNRSVQGRSDEKKEVEKPEAVEEIMNGNAVYFYQSCPVCGRSLKVRVTLLGKSVYCEHCGGKFQAVDRHCAEAVSEPVDRATVLLMQAEEVLLLSSSRQKLGEESDDRWNMKRESFRVE